jgi:hypothetical protein
VVDEGLVQKNAEEVQSLFGVRSEVEKVKEDYQLLLTSFFATMKRVDKELEHVLPEVKPDVIFLDYMICMPSVVNSGIPWVWLLCSDPLCMEKAMDCPSLPPNYSGLSAYGDRNEWKEFREEVNKYLETTPYWNEFNDYLKSKGCELKPYKIVKPSPYLNVYMYPKELDYTDVRPVPEKFVQFVCFERKEETD